MAPDPPQQRTQEQSIKARKNQLFEDDEPVSSSGPRQSFADCLRTTPAAPLSPMVKAILWAVGGLVVLLLAAALATGGGGKKPRAKKPAATTAAPGSIDLRAGSSPVDAGDGRSTDARAWRGEVRRGRA